MNINERRKLEKATIGSVVVEDNNKLQKSWLFDSALLC